MACIDPNRRPEDRDNYVPGFAMRSRTTAWWSAVRRESFTRMPTAVVRIALRFNANGAKREVGPIMLGRDHHDPGGTDSPFRETANITDGSNVTADMATHCFAGNAARGMTMVALHNGGGTGIGKAINGGFGLVLDGSERVDRYHPIPP
jgi:urocanate hydratase